ncbi:uncharacterized protein LOC135640114 [Musa acuminata AAA Group]|uniref:uncharacterized protein LOC135640114 n=1 Tax=Musa acuminata AAA Group TaxID=214697 RepID=UPI0031CE7384
MFKNWIRSPSIPPHRAPQLHHAPLRRLRRQPMASPLLLLRTISSFSPLRVLLLLSAVLILSFLLFVPKPLLRPPDGAATPRPPAPTPTSPRHLLFGIASSSRSWPRRKPYLRIWWRPGLMQGAAFLDSPSAPASGDDDDSRLPPARVSADASNLPYAYKGGLRSAVRVARIVKELIDGVVGNDSSPVARSDDIRWVVLGDDDTLFIPENLAETLARYDWEQWYYVGAGSESVEQNAKHSFSMAFGGGGFAISYPLAKALARVLDSCLVRYAHLYGSDDRVFSCLAELGVGLTHEPGFHQFDLRGDIFGILSAHPLSPLISLHHIDRVEPIFPGMTHVAALDHLFKAVNIDPGRILQQTICYDSTKLLTVSVSWGYVVQVFEGNQLLVDLLSLPQTFTPWRRGRNSSLIPYMLNTRELNKDPCKRPDIFFFESVALNKEKIQSNYTRHAFGNCQQKMSPAKDLKQIRVFSQQLRRQSGLAIRRECCDVSQTSSETVMEINIRKCKDDELIAMHW